MFLKISESILECLDARKSRINKAWEKGNTGPNGLGRASISALIAVVSPVHCCSYREKTADLGFNLMVSEDLVCQRAEIHAAG